VYDFYLIKFVTFLFLFHFAATGFFPGE